LWVNLVTDGLPGLALAVEPAERDTMKRRPSRLHESIFADGMAWQIISDLLTWADFFEVSMKSE